MTLFKKCETCKRRGWWWQIKISWIQMPPPVGLIKSRKTMCNVCRKAIKSITIHG